MRGKTKKPQPFTAVAALETLHVTRPWMALGLSSPAAIGQAAVLTPGDENRY